MIIKFITRHNGLTSRGSVEVQRADVVHVPMRDKHRPLRDAGLRHAPLQRENVITIALKTSFPSPRRTMSNTALMPSSGSVMHVATPATDLAGGRTQGAVNADTHKRRNALDMEGEAAHAQLQQLRATHQHPATAWVCYVA